jgi:hypothetical protein
MKNTYLGTYEKSCSGRMASLKSLILLILTDSFKRTYERWGLKDGEGKLRIETSGREQHRRPRLT